MMSSASETARPKHDGERALTAVSLAIGAAFLCCGFSCCRPGWSFIPNS